MTPDLRGVGADLGPTAEHAERVSCSSRARRRLAILDSLLAVAALLGEDTARFAAAHGMSPARLHLLWVVHAQGPLSQREIAEHLLVSARAVTGLVDALEGSGHVLRTPHPQDRRATLVTLTTSGHSFVESLMSMRNRLAEQTLVEVTGEELNALEATLPKIVERLASITARQVGAVTD